MNENDNIEEQYEAFEGNIRKLEELISQLELWSDEYTINHKKEEVRLPEYVELNNHFEEIKSEMQSFLADREAEEGNTKRLMDYKSTINNRLEAYKATEEIIHQWVRDINDMHILIMKSDILQKNRDYIEAIISAN